MQLDIQYIMPQILFNIIYSPLPSYGKHPIKRF